MHLATTDAGNDLLETDPLALLIGMLLDQQVPMEKAFTSPWVLRERMGRDLDATEIAAYDPEQFEQLFRTVPALHRFPAAMAKRTQAMAQVLVDQFDGRADNVWLGASDGADLVGRLGRLPGFGEQKAKIFAALLGKQLNVQPKGWRQATGEFGEKGSFRSVADIVDEPSLKKVRTYKQQVKAAAKARRGFGVTGLHLGLPAGRVARCRHVGEVADAGVGTGRRCRRRHLPDGQPHARWFLRRFVDFVRRRLPQSRSDRRAGLDGTGRSSRSTREDRSC